MRINNLAIFLLFILSSCLEPYEFEVNDEESYLVIDGEFTTANDSHELLISRTVAFGQKFLIPVTNAEVQIVDGNDHRESYFESEPGKYVLLGNVVRGRSGEQYHLEIKLPDGSLIQSIPDVMPVKVRADSAYHRFEYGYIETKTGSLFFQDRIAVYVDLHLPETEGDKNTFIRWAADELYLFPEVSCGPLDRVFTCYVPIESTSQEINIFNSADIEGDLLLEQNVYVKTSLPRIEFYNRHYISVYQRSITEKTYTYWTKVRDLVNQSGTVFDPPPAAIEGNLKYQNKDELVLGYFELAAVDTVRTIIFPSEYKEEVDFTPYCSHINNTFSAECCNCGLIENATLEKPDWIH